MNLSISRPSGIAASIAMASVMLTGCGGFSSTHASTGAAPSVSSTATSQATTASSTSAVKTSSAPSSMTPLAPKSTTASASRTGAVAPTATNTARAVTPHVPEVAVVAPGTSCYTAYRPNGHMDWGATAGSNVSLGFCKNVGIAAMAHRTDDGSPYDIQASSPTGKVISMHCVTSDTGATCSGGNNAVVEIGWNTGF